MALRSSRDGTESSTEHSKCKADKVKLNASLKASESKLFDAQQRLKELKLTHNTSDQLDRKADEAKRESGASWEHVRYL